VRGRLAGIEHPVIRALAPGAQIEAGPVQAAPQRGGDPLRPSGAARCKEHHRRLVRFEGVRRRPARLVRPIDQGAHRDRADRVAIADDRDGPSVTQDRGYAFRRLARLQQQHNAPRDQAAEQRREARRAVGQQHGDRARRFGGDAARGATDPVKQVAIGQMLTAIHHGERVGVARGGGTQQVEQRPRGEIGRQFDRGALCRSVEIERHGRSAPPHRITLRCHLHCSHHQPSIHMRHLPGHVHSMLEGIRVLP
jgi:hypothetical protein